MCDQLQKMVFKHLQTDKDIEGVIISSNWMKGHIYEIEEIINEIKSSGKKMVLLNQQAQFRESVPNVVLSSISRQQASSKAQSLLSEDKIFA